MTEITVSIEGSEELQAALKSKSKEIAEAAEKAVKITALNLRNFVVKGINQGPATGRIYKKSNPKRTHQASAPGEAPMTDTGRLAGSVFMEVAPISSATIVTVGSRLAYASYLEFGTRRTNDDMRPVWVPGAELARKELPKLLEREIGKVTGK